MRIYEITCKKSQDLGSIANGFLCCPFCGSSPRLYKGTQVDCMTQDNRPAIRCMQCDFSLRAQNIKELRKLWNNRRMTKVMKDCKTALEGIHSCSTLAGEFCKPNVSDMLNVSKALKEIKTIFND